MLKIVIEADCHTLGWNPESGTLKLRDFGFSQENQGQAPPIFVLPEVVYARYANEARDLCRGGRLHPQHGKAKPSEEPHHP